MIYQEYKVSRLSSNFRIRGINKTGVEALKEKISKNGFMDNFPIIINENGLIIDGHHRVEAAKQVGLMKVPVIIKGDLSDSEMAQLAFKSNEASETSVPMTFVDYCEYIWKSNKKLADIALDIGWSEGKTKQYSALQKVTTKAWEVVVTKLTMVTEEVTMVTFNERILRQILKLTEPQQLELVTDLASGAIHKNKFKVMAEKYSSQNEDIITLEKELSESVSKELLEESILEVKTGNYNLSQLIQLAIDKHDKKSSIKLIHGDFYEEVKKVQNESVDLIVTDPPYNIAHERITDYSKNGRGNISKDFGEWDKIGHQEFIDTFKQWAEHFYRILKSHKACYIWTSDIYISHISEAFKEAGFKHKSTLVWHKTNPGTSQMKDNFINSNEYCIYFIKDTFNKEKGSVLNWFGENEMQNFIISSVCGGHERIKDNKNNVLHPTQKPLSVIKHLVDISSNKGDTVFDGFMGTGTTAHVCKNGDRRFIGIEFGDDYYNAAKKRVL